MITTCTKCGVMFDCQSSDEAQSPSVLCVKCYKAKTDKREEMPFDKWIDFCTDHKASFEFSCVPLDQLEEDTDCDEDFKLEILNCQNCKRSVFIPESEAREFLRLRKQVELAKEVLCILTHESVAMIALDRIEALEESEACK